MDPAEEIRNSKRQKFNMLSYVCDSEYGIPRRCPCGGRIIDEVDGLHYRQPWVLGVQEEIERLTKRVEEAEEEQVKLLTEQVDFLTVQVATLEKVCFD
ncbi:hypothetical protein Bca101_058170 [Brassica carinata]